MALGLDGVPEGPRQRVPPMCHSDVKHLAALHCVPHEDHTGVEVRGAAVGVGSDQEQLVWRQDVGEAHEVEQHLDVGVDAEDIHPPVCPVRFPLVGRTENHHCLRPEAGDIVLLSSGCGVFSCGVLLEPLGEWAVEVLHYQDPGGVDLVWLGEKLGEWHFDVDPVRLRHSLKERRDRHRGHFVCLDTGHGLHAVDRVSQPLVGDDLDVAVLDEAMQTLGLGLGALPIVIHGQEPA